MRITDERTFTRADRPGRIRFSHTSRPDLPDTAAAFRQGRCLAFKLLESYQFARQLLGDELDEATAGWRGKLRSLAAARRISTITAYHLLVRRLRDKGLLQRSVLMMVRAATHDLIRQDLAKAQTDKKKGKV